MSPVTPKPSTLRRKGAEAFSGSPFSSQNPFEPDDFELEGRVWPSKVQKGDRSRTEKTGYTSFAPFAEDALKVSKLRSPAGEIQSGRRTPVASMRGTQHRTVGEKIEEEYEDGFFLVESSPCNNRAKPSLPVSSPPRFNLFSRPVTSPPRISTLRRKTDEMFGGSGHSLDPFDVDEDELDGPPPTQTAPSNPLPSLEISPTNRSEAPISLISAEVGIEKFDLERTSVAEVLSKQHLTVASNTRAVSPGLSTLKRESAELLTKEGYFSTSLWDADEDEFSQKLASMRLTPTQRIRGNPLKSLRISRSTTRRTSLFRFETTDETDVARLTDTSLLSLSQGDCSRRLASTSHSPSSSIRALPLRSVFEPYVTASVLDKRPVISVWDAEDDEFDRWPGGEELDSVVKSFTIQRGIYKGQTRSDRSSQLAEISPSDSANSSIHERAFESTAPIRGANMTEQERDDFLHELLDKNCGSPDGLDAHDEVMHQFYDRNCKRLSASNPAGYPHLISVDAYMEDEDAVVQRARPRLVDAVATVLYLTSPKCLADFLNLDVQVFEWRRNKRRMMIRREGNKVIVGKFQNYGTCYVWTFFVRSEISTTGAWKEVYAGASQITTPVSSKGIEFDKLDVGECNQGVNSPDEKYALYVGRALGWFMFANSVWDCHGRYVVEWETDGKATNAREYSYETLRMAYGEEE
jgi:hypothetical protein